MREGEREGGRGGGEEGKRRRREGEEWREILKCSKPLLYLRDWSGVLEGMLSRDGHYFSLINEPMTSEILKRVEAQQKRIY